MSYTINSPEYATLAGVPLQTPAWTHTNLWELWNGPPLRGADTIIPGADGARGHPRRVTSRKVALELVIVGDFDPEGNVQTDRRAGLWANVAALRAIALPTTTGDGSVLMTLVPPTGPTLGARVIVEGFEISGEGPYVARGAIDVTLLAGRFQAGIT